MKNAMLTTVLFGLTMLSCQKKEAVSVASPDFIKSDIEKMEAAYAKAANARDTDAVMPYYADDAVTYSYEKDPVVGKDAIRASLVKEFAEMPAGGEIHFDIKDVFPSSDGNLVVEVGRYSASNAMGVLVATGHYMALFEKRDGKYVCVRDMSTPDTPKAD